MGVSEKLCLCVREREEDSVYVCVGMIITVFTFTRNDRYTAM